MIGYRMLPTREDREPWKLTDDELNLIDERPSWMGASPVVFLLDCIANLQSREWTRNCPQNIRWIVIGDDGASGSETSD